MENLRFTIEEEEIAELLGRQSYSTKESAIFELVKNSYDAGSKTCDIFIDSNHIKIIDYGCGMNEEDIKNNWMHVGKSKKANIDTYKDRVLSGSKGVGRFALARLGNDAKVFSKKICEEAILWETNWVTTDFKKIELDIIEGTIIEINNLRDVWRNKDIENLKSFLGRSYNDNKMVINIHHLNNEEISIKHTFSDIKLGEDYLASIILSYDSTNMNLSISVNSDEFKNEVESLVSNMSINHYNDKFDMSEELKGKFDNLDEYLSGLGSFSAELYFLLGKTSTENVQKFKYKHNNLPPAPTGIVLYRNAFSITSFDGTKDWLDITPRARKSPAAATHLSGSWRVRSNQIYGFVKIDKKINPYLKDLANRQGLEENEYYLLLKEIIGFGLSRFEKYRQSIIRKINQLYLDSMPVKEEKNHIKAFLKSPEKVTTMSRKELSSLAAEIIEVQREADEQTKARVESEKQHKYDVRILNVLATQGLRASAIGHELYNKRSALKSGYEDIINALKEYGFWEVLNSDECTKVAYKNVPGILEELEDINLKLISFIDVILKKVEKQKFQSKIQSIEKTLNEIVETWTSQYTWLKFDISIKNDMPIKYKISKDVLEVIFDNLILNSIQNNEMVGQLEIKFEVTNDGNQLLFKYSDNGVGLSEKYKSDPMRILEVHETSRRDGHGLGMWIVNNTLHMYDGEVIEITSNYGFEIYFSLKG